MNHYNIRITYFRQQLTSLLLNTETSVLQIQQCLESANDLLSDYKKKLIHSMLLYIVLSMKNIDVAVLFIEFGVEHSEMELVIKEFILNHSQTMDEKHISILNMYIESLEYWKNIYRWLEMMKKTNPCIKNIDIMKKHGGIEFLSK